jgi:hypothetical protein
MVTGIISAGAVTNNFRNYWLQKCKENLYILGFSMHFCSSEGRNELDIKECVRCLNAPQAHLNNI